MRFIAAKDHNSIISYYLTIFFFIHVFMNFEGFNTNDFSFVMQIDVIDSLTIILN